MRCLGIHHRNSGAVEQPSLYQDRRLVPAQALEVELAVLEADDDHHGDLGLAAVDLAGDRTVRSAMITRK
jgi:hypothetical protein